MKASNKLQVGEGAVAQKMERRAGELAMNHGRTAGAKTKADIRRAKRELKPLKVTSPGEV